MATNSYSPFISLVASASFNMKFDSLKSAMEDYVSEVNCNSIEKLSEVILDGHYISDLGDLSFLTKCPELGYLSLNKCDIKAIPQFPAGLSIERLELCDNKLTGGLEALSALTHLEELHLGGNQFATLESLKPLSSLKSLRILDVTYCPVEKDSNLHAEVFKMITSLEAFNGMDDGGVSVDFEDGSSGFDEYSDESDGTGSDEDDEEGSDDDDDEDSNDDDSEDEEDDDDEEGEDDDERPSKAARHD
jgi:hypothetical protein